MSAVAAISAVQARIGAIESRLGVARPRVASSAAAVSLVDQAGSTIAARPLGYADVSSGVAGLSTSGSTATVGDFASVARSVEYATGIAAPVAPSWSMPTTVSPVGAADQVATSVPHAALFNEAGARHGIPPRVLAGMAYTESRFRNDVVSSAGAVGMMQFLPATAAGMGVDPYDPTSAIDGAARYLRHALDRFGSLDMAIGAYNIGPGAMARAGGVNPGSQAEKYVSAVWSAAGRMG